ncbi:hypothetical protein CHARACLAT_029282 [Characodon lateralis]|uniref:Uncharacterized protein n=1 Tax=Characodon lateralis TaxID=208331 RepID=A0ABU7D272_9TELE|nr:hypothetical protein [Characodon lateralis]
MRYKFSFQTITWLYQRRKEDKLTVTPVVTETLPVQYLQCFHCEVLLTVGWTSALWNTNLHVTFDLLPNLISYDRSPSARFQSCVFSSQSRFEQDDLRGLGG